MVFYCTIRSYERKESILHGVDTTTQYQYSAWIRITGKDRWRRFSSIGRHRSWIRSFRCIIITSRKQYAAHEQIKK